MSDYINPTKGLNFHLGSIHGHVTGVVHSGIDDIHVFGLAWDNSEPDEMAPGRMVHIRAGEVFKSEIGLQWTSRYGSVREALSWEWITEADFDRIVNMAEIRQSLGWAAWWNTDGLPADRHGDLVTLTVEEVADQLAAWLGKLPGTYWDTRLPSV